MNSIVSNLTLSSELLDSLALITLVIFLALVVLKEFTSNTSNPRLSVLSRGLNIGIVPLGLAFAIIAAARLVRILI